MDHESQIYSRQEIRSRLSRLPRVPVGLLPTPLQECPRLSEALGGPRILVKRDDMTGLAFGGNKTRRLDFVMGDAKQRGCDLIIAGAPLQSNHCRQTAAAANLLGMKAVLVLFGKMGDEMQGNLLLDDLLGAEIVNVEHADLQSVRRFFYEQEEKYRRNGYNPYVLDTLGPSGHFGVLGYVDCTMELSKQFEEQGVTATHIVTPVGSGGTQAGLALGAKLLGASVQVYGVSIRKSKEELTSFITKKSRDTADMLGLDVVLNPEEVVVDDRYVGPGYGVVTDVEREAVRLAARTEALMLDPTYSGKVMGALIDLVKKGRFGPQDTIVFLHTGGTPIIFAKSRALASGTGIHVIAQA